MSNQITLNFDTKLKFHIVAGVAGERVTRAVYSQDTGFVDLRSTVFIGYVDVTTDTDDYVGTINGTHVKHINFERHLDVLNPEAIGNLWGVYSWDDVSGTDEDIELEDLPSNDIPDAILDMLE